MKIGQAFPSRWMKADHLDGPTIFTITDFAMEQMPNDDESKPCLYFKETEMGLLLNVTNSNMIVALLNTDETDQWIGQRIGLRREIVSFKGKPTPAVRVFDATSASVNSFGHKSTPAAAPVDDVPSEWPVAQAAAPVATETEDQSLPWSGDIPDPGAPVRGVDFAKRKKNTY